MSRAELDTALLVAAAARLPDDALAPVRAAALARVRERGLPTTRDEDWKYTNLASAVELSNAWLAALADGGPAAAPSPPELPALDAHVLLIRDGRVDPESLAAVQAAVGDSLAISRLAEQAGGRAADIAAEAPLDALNAALLADGLHIEVRAMDGLDRPLALVFADGDAEASQARVVVRCREQSRLELIEYHARGRERATWANGVIELELAAGARAGVLRVQDRAAEHLHTGKLAARLARDSVLDFASFDLGGGLSRHDVVVDIAEPGASVILNGLSLADGRQHVDTHTRIVHRVGPATSREEYRGILNGRARCVWNGKAIVHEGADGTDAEQANHNLLLSERAEVDTKPELEIYAEDVKCAHGATVGQLDSTALYYLRTRGLDRDAAAHLLTRAFAAQVMGRLPVEALREHLEDLVDARLNELLQEHAS